MPKTATEDFVDRIAKVRETLGLPERQMCELAGIKSPTQIARARSDRSPMNWDHVSALVSALHDHHAVSRDWLLWGDGTMLDPDLRRAALSAAPQISQRKPSGRDGPPSNPAPRTRKSRSRS